MSCLNSKDRFTIVVRNSLLNILDAAQGRGMRISNNVDQRNAIQANNLLEVYVAVDVPIDIVYGDTKVRPVRVGLEDIAPPKIRLFGNSYMKED